jgi:hypothetical protein
MFCPNCSAKNSTDQRFCRSCGMNLEQISSAITEQYPKGAMVDLDRREQRLERFGRIAFGGFGMVIAIAVLGIIYAIVTRMILSGTQPWAGALLVAFIAFAGLTLAYVFFNEDLKEKRKELTKRRIADPVPEPDANTNRLLNQPRAGHVASVVEDTTELLTVENKTRKL